MECAPAYVYLVHSSTFKFGSVQQQHAWCVVFLELPLTHIHIFVWPFCLASFFSSQRRQNKGAESSAAFRFCAKFRRILRSSCRLPRTRCLVTIPEEKQRECGGCCSCRCQLLFKLLHQEILSELGNTQVFSQ